MPFLPPPTINDVPGISSGPELPTSVSTDGMSWVATSDGMNQLEITGAALVVSPVSLTNALPSEVPDVSVPVGGPLPVVK